MRIERDGAAPKASAAVVVLLAALSGVPDAAAEPTHGAPILRNRVDAMTRAALERAGEGALRRLQDAECQQVFSDFRDAEGRPLREKLEATGQTGAGYLSSRILFADGSGALAGLLVWNVDPRSNKTTWKARLTVNDLDKIAHRFIALVLREVESAT